MYKRLLCLIVIMAFTAPALADDIFAPDWRGDPQSQGAIHGFGDDAVWGPPEATWGNPEYLEVGFGGATLWYPPWNTTAGVWNESFMGRTGVWDGGDFGFWLGNFDDGKPVKDIRIQLTYFAAGGTPPEGLDIWYEWYEGTVWNENFVGFDLTGVGYTDPFDTVYVPTDPVGMEIHPDGWVTAAYDLRIYPNPMGEWIAFGPWWSIREGDTTLGVTVHTYLDQVVIDTISYPEPATVALLGLGSLALIRRKRR